MERLSYLSAAEKQATKDALTLMAECEDDPEPEISGPELDQEVHAAEPAGSSQETNSDGDTGKDNNFYSLLLTINKHNYYYCYLIRYKILVKL